MPAHPSASSAARDDDAVCADARRAREAVEGNRETLRVIRRELADAGRLVEAAARDADRHVVADRKVALVASWRAAMEAATTDAARQDATATWMRLVSDTNGRTRAAMRELGRGRRQVELLEARLQAAELEAAAMRIRAETAEAACDEARRVRAAADERRAGSGGAQHVAAAVAGTEASAVEGMDAEAAAAVGQVATIRAADGDTVRRLLAGDQAIHQALAAELAEMYGQVAARYLLLLDALVDELTAAAVDAGELAFDHDHPLWGQFNPDEARLVVRGLRDLGFRLDIREGWFGGRAPAASDLATALGFAGHDVRMLRGIPSAAELRDLPQSVQVAAQMHLRRWAPDLTLDQMARALGPRFARLGELWDEWGRLRPLLTGGLPTPV